MSFINTLIDAPHDLDLKLALHSEFRTLGVHELISVSLE